MNENTCTELIEDLRAYAIRNSIFEKFRNSHSVSDELCKKTTGLRADEFLEVFDDLISMKDSINRTKSQALAIYLFWLKSGLSQITISAYFGNELTQIDISHINQQVRNALTKHFVPKHIGSKAITRAQLISRNSPFVNTFCDSKQNKIAAVVADATYLEIVCAPDGYIVDIYGLYPATWNDAKILVDILEDLGDLPSLLSEGDFWILDRGFRDCIDVLEKTYNFKTMMPCFLDKSQKQFTTEQANESRMVTKMRWVIESINGILKKCFRALDGRLENKSLPHTHEDMRIAGS